MADEIRIATIYLENLASRMEQTARELKGYTDLGGDSLACSPIVDDAYNDLANKWNVHRDKLSLALEALSEGFRTASQNFRAADAELAGALEGSGSAD